MTKELTGRLRFRPLARWFGAQTILVLQVEEHTSDGPPDNFGIPSYLAGTFWRDARVEDGLVPGVIEKIERKAS